MSGFKTWVITVFLLSPAIGLAQLTGIIEDFNDNTLTNWQFHEQTFELTESDSMLKVNYHRTSESWEWDNFRFILPEQLDAGGNPFISVKVKSDIVSEFEVKVTYAEAGEDWLQVILPDDNQWHQYGVELQNADGNLLERLYFYLDGGATIEASGMVYLDDLKIGDPAQLPLDCTRLEDALGAANSLVDFLPVGSEEGEVSAAAHGDFQNTIQSAQNFYDGADSSVTQSALDSTTSALYNACVNFETSVHLFRIQPTDSLATRETKYLYEQLKFWGPTNLMFGMHDATG